MTSKLTIEQAKRLRNDFECWQQDYDPKDDKEQYDMFGRGMFAMDMLIAGMYQEPVAYTDERNLGYIDRGRETAYLWGKQNSEASDVALYRHAQPAQISEPVLPLQDKDLQGVIDALEHPAGINAAGKQVVRHALVELQERRKVERDTEPYGFTDGDRRGMIYKPEHSDRLSEPVPVYRHAQQPVVPDESYQQLSELYHAQEKRLFKIARRIKGPAFDKYSHSPSQAIDVLEVVIFGDDESCRAAMLNGGKP